jgi:hypothetical protein
MYTVRIFIGNNGQIPQKMCLFYMGLFYSYRKKKQLCRRFFFQFEPIFVEKIQFENFKITVVPFFKGKKGTYSIVVKN